MGELKHSKKADRVGYLYRAAFYLAQGDIEASYLFLQKSSEMIPSARVLSQTLLENKKYAPFDNARKRVFAEKILDEFKKQMFLLRRDKSLA